MLPYAASEILANRREGQDLGALAGLGWVPMTGGLISRFALIDATGRM